MEESADYLAIMDLFSATLLTDLSATEVAAQLAERGLNLPRDTVEARCRQLVGWGNLRRGDQERVDGLRRGRVRPLAYRHSHVIH